MKRQCKAQAHSTGERCRRAPIAGAEVCRVHGGASPQVKAAAARRLEHAAAEQAVRTYGLPVDIDPSEALLEEVRRTAGHVAWLNTLIGEGDQNGLTQWVHEDGGGAHKRESVWVVLYHKERAQLVNVCKAAIAAGIAEREVRIAERQGELVAELVRVAVDAAGLTPAQRERAYGAVRGHLTRVA
jgi:hypothetical protein